MVSKKSLGWRLKKYQHKKHEINNGQDSLDIDFLGANRQLDLLELSLVYDKSDKHTTIYNIYNVKMAAKKMKSVKLMNFTEIYSLTNEKNMTLTT